MSGKRTEDSNKEHWYYDACMLDKGKSQYAELFNSPYPVQAIISHLTLGEAFANSYLKGSNQLDAFVELIKSLGKYITIVQYDGSTKTLNTVQESFPALSITDAMHMATALDNRCVCIKTIDPDFCGLSRPKLNELGNKYGLEHFSISKK